MRNFLFFAVMLFSLTAWSQKNGQTSNNIPTRSKCECFAIVDACSGDTLDISGSYTVSCVLLSDGKPWERTATFSNGEICIPPSWIKGCSQPKLCINSGNWEVCDINGCSIEVFQTVPFNGDINGEMIGYFNGGGVGDTGGTTDCVGQVHSGPINNIHGRDKILLCPGDPVIFSLPGLSIPQESGLCLTVTLRRPNGTEIASRKFDSNSVNGNQVDLTELFSVAENEIYILEYKLSCCEGESSCTVNTVKYAYIEVSSPFYYKSYAIGGFEPNVINFRPSIAPPSSQLPGGTVIPNTDIVVNQLTFVGYSVQNPNNISINWNFFEVSCDGGNDENLEQSGTQIPSNPFNIGPFLITTTSDCQCYRLDISYDDGCGNGITTDSYYFKEGVNCSPDALQSPETEIGFLIESLEDQTIHADNKIHIDLRDSYTNENLMINIYDTQGRLVETKSLQINGHMLETTLDLSQGLYIYNIEINGKIMSGKLIKL